MLPVDVDADEGKPGRFLLGGLAVETWGLKVTLRVCLGTGRALPSSARASRGDVSDIVNERPEYAVEEVGWSSGRNGTSLRDWRVRYSLPVHVLTVESTGVSGRGPVWQCDAVVSPHELLALVSRLCKMP